MVVAIRIADCDVCGSKEAFHEIHETAYGGSRVCVACYFLKKVETEWPYLYWVNRKRSFVINHKACPAVAR
jgi:hypothetical protein